MGILGARGDHPVYLQPPAGKSLDEVAEIPGVRIFGSGVRCTWEVAEVVAELLGIPAPQPPIPLGPPSLTDAQVNHYLRKMPGLARYHELGLGSKLRDYQKVGTVYLALRSYGLNCDPPRAGKCIQALSAAVLQGARKILIVGPAQALMGWAEEAARWLDTEAVLLRGRSGHSARQFCKVCMGSGRAANATYCPACRLGNGQSNGTKILRLGDPDPDRELTAALGRAQVVIVNYELLQGQNQRNSLGIIGAREDLPGWGPTLARYHFDVAVGDEIHQLRGWGTDRNRAGQTKRERFIQVVDRIPTVWGLTGTPVFGEIKDLWGPLDAVSRGAITGPGRKWFKFTIRYANAHKGEHGWVYNGFSIYAETELPRRLIGTKIQRQRSEILAQMPPKQRIVHRIEQSATTAKALASAARNGGALDRVKITKLLGQTGAVKRDEVVANVMDQLSAGNKVIVYTLLTSSAERLHKELNKAAAKREWAPRMRQENLKTWMVHGNNVAADKRYHVARAFRDHPGAALLVATIDSMQVGLDLSGATNVHFAELHYSPAAAQQAEDRPYKPGITQGLTVEYYIVRSSIDERIEETLMPKLFAQEAAVAEPAAADMRAAFAGPEEDEDEIFARLTSAIRDGSAPDIEDIEED